MYIYIYICNCFGKKTRRSLKRSGAKHQVTILLIECTRWRSSRVLATLAARNYFSSRVSSAVRYAPAPPDNRDERNQVRSTRCTREPRGACSWRRGSFLNFCSPRETQIRQRSHVGTMAHPKTPRLPALTSTEKSDDCCAKPLY